jgi:hypothetical protein
MQIFKPATNIFSPGVLHVPTGRLWIDWQHPLANGLAMAFVGDCAYDLARPSTTTINTATNFKTTITPEGPATQEIIYNYDCSSIFTSNPNSAISIYCRGLVISAGANFPYVFGTIDNSGVDHLSIFGNTSFGSVQGTWNDSAKLLVLRTIGAFPTFVSLGMAGTINGTMFGYSDGVQTNTTTFGTTFGTFTHPPNSVVIGTGGSSHNIVSTNCGYIWQRQLTADEMLWLHVEPYAFLVPDVSSMMFPGSLLPAPLMGQIWM